MVRYSYALLSFFLLTCVLVQRSHCSRSVPDQEPQKPALPSVVHGDERLRREETLIRPVGKSVIADHPDHGGNADGALPSPATIPAAADHGGAGSQRGSGALSQAWRYSVVPHLKLARRFLVGDDADSAAGPSCRSNNAHITCSPPAPH